MGYGLGIDIGTAFVAAAVTRGGPARMAGLGPLTPLLPSVVRSRPDNSLQVGAPLDAAEAGRPEIAAHQFRRRLGDSTPIPLGERAWRPGELMTALISAALERVVDLEGEHPDHVALTCPAVWGPYRREQFTEVIRKAGIPRDRVTLLTDAEAAGTYYLAGRPVGPKPIAVYDAGGSTLDATVIRTVPAGPPGLPQVNVLGVPESVEWFGGIDIDDAVLRHLDSSTDGAVSMLDPRRPDEAIRLHQARESCVRAKEALSTVTEVALDTHLGRPALLSRTQLEEWVRAPLTAGLQTLRRVLDGAGVRPADLESVLLVGGTARMPLVSRMLAKDLGRNVVVPPKAQYAAALGAAMIAGHPTRAPDASAATGSRAAGSGPR